MITRLFCTFWWWQYWCLFKCWGWLEFHVSFLVFASALRLRFVVRREYWAQLCVVVDLGADRCSQGAPVCPKPGHKSPSLWLPRLAPSNTWYLRRPAPGDISCLSPIQARQGPRFSIRMIIWIFYSDTVLLLFGVDMYFSCINCHISKHWDGNAV